VSAESRAAVIALTWGLIFNKFARLECASKRHCTDWVVLRGSLNFFDEACKRSVRGRSHERVYSVTRFGRRTESQWSVLKDCWELALLREIEVEMMHVVRYGLGTLVKFRSPNRSVSYSFRNEQLNDWVIEIIVQLRARQCVTSTYAVSILVRMLSPASTPEL
jgi:hypothetical protein